MAKAYCRTCDLTFGGVRAFDQHLRWLDVEPWVEHREPPDSHFKRADGVVVRRYGVEAERAV